MARKTSKRQSQSLTKITTNKKKDELIQDRNYVVEDQKKYIKNDNLSLYNLSDSGDNDDIGVTFIEKNPLSFDKKDNEKLEQAERIVEIKSDNIICKKEYFYTNYFSLFFSVFVFSIFILSIFIYFLNFKKKQSKN